MYFALVLTVGRDFNHVTKFSAYIPCSSSYRYTLVVLGVVSCTKVTNDTFLQHFYGGGDTIFSTLSSIITRSSFDCFLYCAFILPFLLFDICNQTGWGRAIWLTIFLRVSSGLLVLLGTLFIYPTLTTDKSGEQVNSIIFKTSPKQSEVDLANYSK